MSYRLKSKPKAPEPLARSPKRSTQPPPAPPGEDNPPIGRLQLSTAATNILRRNGLVTIDEFLQAVVGDTPPWTKESPAVVQEIEAAADRLVGAIGSAGTIDWGAYQKPPLEKSSGSIHPGRRFLQSDLIKSVSKKVGSTPLGALQLRRAQAPIEAIGVRTIGELVRRLRAGFQEPKRFGLTSENEVLDSVAALHASTAPGGEVDWMGYAKRLGFEVIPARPSGGWTAPKLLAHLNELCRAALLRQFNPEDWVIFEKRFLAPPAERLTLQALGNSFGVTREYIRLRQELTLDAIRRPLMEEDYRGLHFRFRPEVGEPLRLAAKYLKTSHSLALSSEHWTEMLAIYWGVPAEEVQNRSEILHTLIGPSETLSSRRGLERPVVLSGRRSAKTSRKTRN